MDALVLNTVVGIVGIVVGVIGAIIGIIGWKSLATATKIKNKIEAGDHSSVQQAQVINNGLDAYAVIRLSRETTQEELKKVVEDLQPMVWGEFDEIITDKVNKSLDERSTTIEEINELLGEI